MDAGVRVVNKLKSGKRFTAKNAKAAKVDKKMSLQPVENEKASYRIRTDDLLITNQHNTFILKGFHSSMVQIYAQERNEMLGNVSYWAAIGRRAGWSTACLA